MEICRAFDTLSARKIKDRLAGHPWGARVVVLDSTDSTNLEARRLASTDAPAGTAVLADHQTAGRGRLGRSFHSPAGAGLYLSVILRPKVPPNDLFPLTALCAVAAARAVAQVCGTRPGIKWVNDLVFGTRKLAGILTELRLSPENGAVDHVVVGIGINCESVAFPEELAGKITSIAAETGKTGIREELAAALLRELSGVDSALSDRAECGRWLAEFAENCITLGKEVRILRGDAGRVGRAVGIGPAAELLVEYPDGSREAVASGEATVRGMYDYV